MKVHDFVYYNDGNLIHKERPRGYFKDERCYQRHLRKVGKIADREKLNRARGQKYKTVFFNGYKFMSHRIIWELFNHEIPDGMHVDHINRDSMDNRIDNLRLVTNEQNARNRRVMKKNKSGKQGVSMTKSGKWIAVINSGGNQVYLGTYKHKQSAINARVEAELFYGYTGE